MKMIIAILGLMSMSLTASARDTDDLRNELLRARAAVVNAQQALDNVINGLKQTRFSESATIQNLIDDQW